MEGAGDDRQFLRLLFNVGAWERVYRNDMRLTFPVKLMFLLLIIYFGDLHCQNTLLQVNIMIVTVMG